MKDSDVYREKNVRRLHVLHSLATIGCHIKEQVAHFKTMFLWLKYYSYLYYYVDEKWEISGLLFLVSIFTKWVLEAVEMSLKNP